MSDDPEVAVLLRNRTGDVIHSQGCPALQPGAVRWRWADENPDEDWKVTAPWLRACRRCNPPSPARIKDLMVALRESLEARKPTS